MVVSNFLKENFIIFCAPFSRPCRPFQPPAGSFPPRAADKRLSEFMAQLETRRFQTREFSATAPSERSCRTRKRTRFWPLADSPVRRAKGVTVEVPKIQRPAISPAWQCQYTAGQECCPETFQQIWINRWCVRRGSFNQRKRVSASERVPLPVLWRVARLWFSGSTAHVHRKE